MPRQSYIVRGRRAANPYGLAQGIRQQASQLPGLYAQKMQREFQDQRMGIEREKLGLSKQALAMRKQAFKDERQMARRAESIAQGGVALQGGLGLLKYGATKGMFDDTGDRLESWKDRLFGGAQAQATGQQEVTPATQMDASHYQDNPTQQGSGPSFTDRYAGGDIWGQSKSGAFGGLAGGLTGAGMARSFGAKKKWQTAAAGAGMGMLSSFLAGGDSPYAMAMGGILGGGLGALL